MCSWGSLWFAHPGGCTFEFCGAVGAAKKRGQRQRLQRQYSFSRSELLLREPSSLLPHGRLRALLRDIFSDAFGEELKALALQSVLPLCMS